MNENDPTLKRESSILPAPPREQRVSMLIGDRLCAQCGYNLTGQAILREPHYQMLIVRCPECGTAASVQEYPLLGRWANRWAALLAAIWMLILFGAVVGTGATIFGFSVATAEEAANTYQQFLADRYQTSSRPTTTITGARAIATARSWSSDDYKQWRDQQNFDALFAEAGGWRGAVNWLALILLIPFAIVVFMEGCVLSITTLGVRWRGQLLLILLVMTIALLFATIAYLDWFNSRFLIHWVDARQRIGPPVMFGSLLFGAIILTVGLLAGRKIVRWLVRILLPPRLCQSLAMLWTSEGLDPPRTLDRT